MWEQDLQRGGRKMSDIEFNWLIAHPEEAEKYPGEYITIVGESIVAHDKDFKAALEPPRARLIRNPLSTRFPLPTERLWCD
jgi:hypothetical protein